MNQILSTEAPKSNKKVRGGNREPADIEKILKFFAIGMILFGIFMIGSGSYAMYQNSKLTGSSSKPTISFLIKSILFTIDINCCWFVKRSV